LPPCSPDLNLIEMALLKLRALIRKAASRPYDELWRAVGHVCDLSSDEACYNFFKAAGYRTD
jgi:transposase